MCGRDVQVVGGRARCAWLRGLLRDGVVVRSVAGRRGGRPSVTCGWSHLPAIACCKVSQALDSFSRLAAPRHFASRRSAHIRLQGRRPKWGVKTLEGSQGSRIERAPAPALPLGGAKGEKAPPRATVLRRKIQAPPVGGVRSLDLSSDPALQTQRSVRTAGADPERGRPASEWGWGGLAQVRAGDTSEALLLPSQSGFCRGRFPLRPSGDASDPRCIAGGSRARRPPGARPSRRPPGPQLHRLGARARGGGRKGRGQSSGGARGAEGRGLEEAGPGTSCDSEGQG